jgi:hypothetical protein
MTRLTLLLTALALSASSHLDAAAQTTWKFDFGSAAAPGSTAVRPDTAFTAKSGYGFGEGATVTAIQRGGADKLRTRCVVEGIRAAKLDLIKLLAPDVTSFDPSHPDRPDAWALPTSPFVATQKPEGN